MDSKHRTNRCRMAENLAEKLEPRQLLSATPSACMNQAAAPTAGDTQAIAEKETCVTPLCGNDAATERKESENSCERRERRSKRARKRYGKKSRAQHRRARAERWAREYCSNSSESSSSESEGNDNSDSPANDSNTEDTNTNSSDTNTETSDTNATANGNTGGTTSEGTTSGGTASGETSSDDANANDGATTGANTGDGGAATTGDPTDDSEAASDNSEGTDTVGGTTDAEAEADDSESTQGGTDAAAEADSSDESSEGTDTAGGATGETEASADDATTAEDDTEQTAEDETSSNGLASVEARNEFGIANDIAEFGDPSLGTPLRRVTTPSYPGDGSGAQWAAPEPASLPTTPPNTPENTGTAVQPLKITDTIYAPGSEVDRPNSGGLNEYSQFFAQFVTHDMVHSARAAGPPIFYDGQFIPVSRTPSVEIDGVRQPISTDTPTLDLGLVYGRDEASTQLLREVVIDENGNQVAGGKLLAGGAGDVLPSYFEVAAATGMSVEDVQATLGTTFLNLPPEALGSQAATGDERANQTTSLTAHHTIWFRNHNYHAENLRAENPEWSEEQVYQAARALNEAEYQKVIYDEYLPKLLGEDALSEYSGYKADVDPSIINEWTTVAFRFGHDQTSEGQLLITETGEVSFVPLPISSQIANFGQNIDTDEQLGDWTRGQLAQFSQEIDGRIGPGLRNALFGVPASADDPTATAEEFLQLNLPLLDIHRGRDHGVSDYNQLRSELGLETYSSLEEFAHANHLSQERLDQLNAVYSDISELDSIVGGLLEKDVPGGQFGEMFTVLNVMQFEATRDGDEFFYKNRFKDSPEVLEQIEQSSMSEILVRVGAVDQAPEDAFQGSIPAGFDNVMPTPLPNPTPPGGGDQGGGDVTEPNVIQGTPDDDRLFGTDEADQISGGEGNDRLVGNAGDDVLQGERGEDFLGGGDGNDQLDGGDGNDTLVGGNDDDQLRGGDGDDELFGQDGNDELVGEMGNDELSGGEGDDRLFGRLGDDQLVGDDGNDELRGGQGDDRLLGSDGDDWLLGESGDDELAGGRGNDRLEGGDGTDQLFGRAGDDELNGGAGDDRIDGGDGTDIASFNGLVFVACMGNGTIVVESNDGRDELTNVEFIEADGVRYTIAEALQKFA